MSSKLVVVINGDPHLEYDREKTLPEAQRAYLDRLDADMDQGFEIAGQHFADPDRMQRAQFMAINLVQAMQASQDAIIAATCAWLADRLPDLKQVRVVEKDGNTGIELVFDRDYGKETKLNFVPRSSLN